MEDIKKIQEFFSKPLKEGKQLDQVDFAKVVKAVEQTGHPVTVLLVPKFNEIEVLTGMDAPDDMLRDLSNAVDSLGYGRNDIFIAADSSNLSRREYSDIRRVNGGAKDYFEESVNENEDPIIVKYFKRGDKYFQILVKYEKPVGFTTALGSRTALGQQNDQNEAAAQKRVKTIVNNLKADFDLDEIFVEEGQVAGRYYINAFSDDFIDMDVNDIEEIGLKESVKEVTRYGGFIRNPEDPDSEPFNPTGSVAEFREDLRALFGKFKGDLKNPEFIKGVAEIMVNWKSLLRSQLEENKPVANVNKHIKAIQIQLDQLGVKYEMSGNPYKPFKAVYKPINKDDKWYDNFEDIVFRYNLGGVVKTSMNEGAEDIMDAYNDVLDLVKKHSRRLSDDDSYAFGLKLKSWFNKNILDEATKDEETTFHKKLDKLVHDTFGKRKGELEESSSSEEKRIAKRAIKSIAKYRGVSEDEARNDLIRAAKELGSLKEDMSLDDQAKAYYLAKVKRGEIDTLPEDPKAAFLTQMMKDQISHDKETLRRERGLEETAAYIAETIKLGMMVNEELCDKGKRYIKARQAAGEKSSAYLSGRAVRVCKGQIEWPKKGKKKK